jgi:hypothetical protein
MKKILMAAVAVTALTAGSASAAKLSLTESLMGLTNVYAGTGVNLLATDGTSNEPFTLANEYTTSAATTVYGKLVMTPTGGATASSVGQGNYVVTFTLTGGKFANPELFDTTAAFINAEGNGGVAGDITINSVSSASDSTVAYNITVAAGKFLGKVKLNAPILTGTSQATVTAAGSLTTGGLAVDGGSVPAITLLDYRNGYAFGVTKASTVKLSILSGFKKFGTGVVDATSANLATAVGFVTTNGLGVSTNGYQASDYVYKATATTGAGQNKVDTADITSIVATVAGDFSSFDPFVGSLKQVSDAAAATGVFTLDATNLGQFKGATGTVGLKQKAVPVAGGAASYTIAAVPTITGLAGTLGVSYPAKALASTALEGTNIYAAWIGDGSNGFSYTIRLGNLSPAAINSVKAYLLNPITTGTTGTVASTATCEVGPIPALKELLVTSEMLKTCFGEFKRADVRLTIQTDSTNLTAKLRVVDPVNGTTQTSLGTGQSEAVQ